MSQQECIPAPNGAMPNECGVYDKTDADQALSFVAGDLAYVKAWVMQMPSGLWDVGYDCRYGDGACSGPLMDVPHNEDSEQGAVGDFLDRIVEDLENELERGISDEKKGKCRDLLRLIAEYRSQGRLFW